LRSFLGLCNYTRQFVRNYASIALPLFQILKNETKRSIKQIMWNEERDNAFKKLKGSICDITYRAQPNFANKFILTTDASNYAIGGILSQQNSDGKEEMIYAYSKGLDKAQLNYSVTDKELLAVVKCLEHFRHYLIGKEFLLRTDHKALEYLWNAQNPNSRMLRWSLKIQDFKFQVKYIKGEDNYADGISRQPSLNPIKSSREFSQAEKSEIMLEYHLNSGHGSKGTMIFLMKDKYSWKGIFKDIENFCQSCQICLKSGGPRINTKNRIITTTRPNQLWQCDLIGRLRNEEGQNKFIFVAIDHYSKWTEACVLNRKSAQLTADAVQKLIIDKHGSPESILSDNGLEFCNNQIKDICDK
ncbi:MAG: RNase H-like domain-containing protein, partial [Bacteroidales bacterium]